MKKALVIGAARSGLAAARMLNEHGYEIWLTDLKPVQEKEILEAEGIHVHDGGHPDFLHEMDFDLVIKNPGIPYHAPFVAAMARKYPIYTEIDPASQLAENFRYGAVTGTDGKTTITTLLEKMLQARDARARSAGNIGIPLSELVLEKEQGIDVALELSNFQLLGMEHFHPHAAVISNLAPDHQDYMRDLDAYYRSKFRILQNMDENDVFILNLDDPTIVEYFSQVEDKPFRVLSLSLREPADVHVENGSVWLDDIRLFDVKDLRLKGDFNLMNAMMAAALAYSMDVTPAQIRETIRSFAPIEHRIEYLGSRNGVEVYNDSKSTNTHSTIAALSAFDRPVYLLCGGFDKGIDYSELVPWNSSVKKCLSFGKIADQFREVFEDTETFETMEQALDRALEEAGEGDIILLSPATSSFDQFRNYEERGRVFKKLAAERGVA